MLHRDHNSFTALRNMPRLMWSNTTTCYFFLPCEKQHALRGEGALLPNLQEPD